MTHNEVIRFQPLSIRLFFWGGGEGWGEGVEGRPDTQVSNSPFPCCCEPHFESEAKCKSFSYEINFVYT